MHGVPREPLDFSHFSYADPDAPKGGRARFAKQGTYDSLNPFIVKGVSVDGVREYVYETLMARAYDEPFTLYGLIAEAVETPTGQGFGVFTGTFADSIWTVLAFVTLLVALRRFAWVEARISSTNRGSPFAKRSSRRREDAPGMGRRW